MFHRHGPATPASRPRRTLLALAAAALLLVPGGAAWPFFLVSGSWDCTVLRYDCESWTFTAPSDGPDHPVELRVGPDHQHVFLAGHMTPDWRPAMALTMALDAGTGHLRWSHLHAPAKGAQATALDIGGDPTSVFVGGEEDRRGYVMALDGATGTVLWQHTSAARPVTVDDVLASRVAPAVIVAGQTGGDAYVTAIHATTGTPLWTTTFGGPAGTSRARIVLEDAGGTLHVIGVTGPPMGSTDLFVLSLDPAAGAIVASGTWGGPTTDWPAAATLGDAGPLLYVTGRQGEYPDPLGDSSWFTLAWDLARMGPAWTHTVDSRYAFDRGNDVAYQGGVLYVAGASADVVPVDGVPLLLNHVTVRAHPHVLALDGASGSQLWSTTYSEQGRYPPGRPLTESVSVEAAALAPVPAAATVIAAGTTMVASADALTLTVEASTGRIRDEALFDTRDVASRVWDRTTDLEVSRDGKRAFLAVESGDDLRVVAYDLP